MKSVGREKASRKQGESLSAWKRRRLGRMGRKKRSGTWISKAEEPGPTGQRPTG